jgi:hypothetical protein
MYRENNELTSTEAMIRQGGTFKQIENGKLEFENFAKSTYKALIKAEPFNPSSLKQICRIDISVIMNPATDRFEYFVNEVERGHLICLFGHMTDNTFSPQLVGDQTGDLIERFLDNYYDIA